LCLVHHTEKPLEKKTASQGERQRGREEISQRKSPKWVHKRRNPLKKKKLEEQFFLLGPKGRPRRVLAALFPDRGTEVDPSTH